MIDNAGVMFLTPSQKNRRIVTNKIVLDIDLAEVVDPNFQEPTNHRIPAGCDSAAPSKRLITDTSWSPSLQRHYQTDLVQILEGLSSSRDGLSLTLDLSLVTELKYSVMEFFTCLK